MCSIRERSISLRTNPNPAGMISHSSDGRARLPEWTHNIDRGTDVDKSERILQIDAPAEPWSLTSPAFTGYTTARQAYGRSQMSGLSKNQRLLQHRIDVREPRPTARMSGRSSLPNLLTRMSSHREFPERFSVLFALWQSARRTRFRETLATGPAIIPDFYAIPSMPAAHP
jgi:hypothetical protein